MNRKVLADIATEVARVGHRGAASHAPLNTLAALEQGIESSADFAEFDVYRTRDGRLGADAGQVCRRHHHRNGKDVGNAWEEPRQLDAGESQRVLLFRGSSVNSGQPRGSRYRVHYARDGE